MMNKFLITKPGVYNYKVTMDEMNTEKELLGIVKAETEGDYEINLLSKHLVGKTKCRVEIKGVVSNGARVKVKGMVKMDKGAVGSDSFLAMKLLMLDNRSMATAEPELEILNNEVTTQLIMHCGLAESPSRYFVYSYEN